MNNGKYYKIILDILGVDEYSEGIKYLYKKDIEGVYKALPHYFKKTHVVNKDEFITSMRCALNHLFGDGCEVEEIEGMWDFLN